MSFPAQAIANEFIRLARESGETITPLKLQKLVYFAHGWSLAIRDEPLINENVQAWQYGPVIPELYSAFKLYGNSPIRTSTSEVSLEDFSDDQEEIETTRKLIDRVWHVYRGFTAAKLSTATHQKGTPWASVYTGNKFVDIPNDMIKEYFVELVYRDAQNTNPAVV